MACTIYQGREIDCRDSMGGVQEIYIAEFANVQSITETSGVITAITMVSGKKFYTFQVEKENGSLTETENGSVENGTLFYEQVVNFSIKKGSSSQRNALNVLAKARLMVIVKDNNGVYWLVGKSRAADKVGDNNFSTGKAFGDQNGYNVTLTAKEPNPVVELTAALITSITA